MLNKITELPQKSQFPVPQSLSDRLQDVVQLINLTREELHTIDRQLDALVDFCGAHEWVYDNNKAEHNKPVGE